MENLWSLCKVAIGLFYAAFSFILIFISFLLGGYWLISAFVAFCFFVTGLFDYFQKKRAVLGNFPLLGRFIFIFESIRPELRQYFWEADNDELPYSRNQRAMVYQDQEILAARPLVLMKTNT